MKNLIISIYIFILSFSGYSNSNLPLIIKQDDRVFHTISSSISRNLPKNIQILFYDIFFMNGDKETSETVNNNFKIIITSQQYINKYSSIFIDDIKTKFPNIDYSFVKKIDEKELLSFGKFTKADAVMISSATIIEGKNKVVWDIQKAKFAKKRIILFQGNIFNTENSSYLMRITHYFLID